jgi:hypothetical protein
MHAQISGGHLKGATGTGRGLFKDEGDALALAETVGDARLLLGLQIGGQVEQIRDLFGSEIKKLQKMVVLQRIHGNLRVFVTYVGKARYGNTPYKRNILYLVSPYLVSYV